MRSTLVLPAALMLVAMALPSTVRAASSEVIETLSSKQMVRLLSQEGFNGATIDPDDDIVVNMQGYKVLVMVRGNEYQRLSYRFAIGGIRADLHTVNEWNKKMAFTKAYLDDEGNPVLEMDVDLEGGVTVDRIRDSITTFDRSLMVFLHYLHDAGAW